MSQADAPDSTPASDGQFALTVDDLNTAVNHEPRVEDVRLAEALGMDRSRNIRKLIERHRVALERLGEVCSTVEQTSSKGGRPGRTFWLNRRQALYICTKSETPRATETTIAMVELFYAHLAGTLAAPVKVRSHRRALPRQPSPDGAAPAAPAATPRLDQDGYALVRLAGEILLVDLQRIAPGQAGRAVAIGWDARVTIEDMAASTSNAKFLGARSVLLPDPTNPRTGTRSVAVVGGVVASQPATTPGKTVRSARPAAKRTKAPRAGAALPPRPDLAALAVCGRA